MGLLDIFRSSKKAVSTPDPDAAFHRQVATIVKAYGEFLSMDDPALAEFMRTGSISTSGITISEDKALQNPAVFRSVNLISRTIGMLPFHMIDKTTKEKAIDHPLFTILHRKPNEFQTASEFRTLMQERVLTKGNAYARILRGAMSKQIRALLPLDPDLVTPKLRKDWTMVYEYRPKSGPVETYTSRDILHLRGFSKDGICGIPLIKIAANAIGIALSAELAAARFLKNGTIVSGWLETGQVLGETALNHLKESWNNRYAGSENAGGTPILEQGLTYKTPQISFKDAQYNELRARQVEEIARVFDVPRPLLMVDDTSWGSGIEVLGEHFVRYGLNAWFELWQQACELALLSDVEQKQYEIKFNAGALTRGSLKDQGDYFSKASGAGGHKPWMSANEIRAILDMPPHPDGDGLTPSAEAMPERGIGDNGGPPLDDERKAA